MAQQLPPSTQHFLNISDIRDDILILKNGEFRQILEVQALNFALKSEQEQAAIIYQYQAFLNSLQFPVQIIIQSRRLDLTNYLNDLKIRMDQSTNQLIRAQIADYLSFIGQLINLGNIMEKHFYVVVPYSDPGTRGRNLFTQLFNKKEAVQVEDKVFATVTTKMNDRTESIRSGLASIGLGVGKLNRDQIIRLLYSTYNPVEAGEVALPNDADGSEQRTQAA
jgi:hypothetical protein